MSGDEVLLVLEGGRLTCRRSSLSGASPYFLAMFTKGFAETEKQEVSLHGIDYEAMKILVGYLEGRSTKDDLKESNVMSVLQAAGMLHFEPVRSICCDFIKSILSVKNCLQVLCETDVLGETEIHHLAMKYVLWNFKKSTSVPYLSEVPLYVLKLILDSPHANVKAETVVFEVIKRWIEADLEERIKYGHSLLSCLKYNCLGPKDLQTMMKEEFVRGSQESRKLIESELRHRSMSLDAASTSSLDILPSEAPGERRPPIYPCVVGRLKPQSAVKITDKDALPYLFVFKDGSVEPYLSLSKMVNSSVKAQGYQVSSVGHELFITGGEFILGRSNWNKNIWSYNTMSSTWRYVCGMEVARRHHSVCVTRSDPDEDDVHPYMYLVGGYGKHRIILDKVDRLCLDQNVMSELPNLPAQMYCPAVCFFRGMLYVIRTSVYCYDPKTGKWSKLDHIDLPKHMEFNCALVSDNHIYLTGNHSYELYRFDPTDNPKPEADPQEITLEFGDEQREVKEPPQSEKVELEFVGRFTNEAQNVCMVFDVIYNFSTEQFDYKSSVETFDLRKNTFSIAWEKNTDDFDFSPYYSSGCFPIVLYN